LAQSCAAIFLDFLYTSALSSKLRNARLLAKLREHHSYYQVNKLQFNNSAPSASVPQNGIKGNFKRVSLQRDITEQQSFIEQMIFPRLEKSLETIWMSFWKDKFSLNGFREMPEFGQDIFTLYDQINIGIPAKLNYSK